jgi:chromosome segregation protein
VQFEKLRLSGFKSFVDTTEMLVRPGVTGVVGPNGCGKSNLLEAMRWVMGETSPKSVRGFGMEDVIFAGAATRSPRHYAEVALVIDNLERRAPQAFNDADTIEITRRIARDSGSTYRYNGREVRARDVQTLFADAATGANSPALVRQGQISEIIGAKPRARRRILEDAAGIAGLHARRHEAQIRLNAAETNMERITEILTQFQAREATLEREAARASRYRTLSQEVRNLESMLAFRRWREADREKRSAQALMEAGASRAAKAAQTASQANRKRLSLEENTPNLKEEEAIARALHQRLLIEKESLQAKEREAKAAAERLERQIARHRADLMRESETEQDAKATIERLKVEFAALPDAETPTALLEKLKDAETAAAAETQRAEQALDLLTSKKIKRDTEISVLKARIEEQSAKAKRLTDEAREAEALILAIDEEIAVALETVAVAREDIDDARAAIEKTEIAAFDAEGALSTAEEASIQAKAAALAASGRAVALRSEANALAALVGSENRDRSAGVIDILDVASGAEAALAAAFGDALAGPVIEAGGERGWRDLGTDATEPLPSGSETLALSVSAPTALAKRLSMIGLVDATLGWELQTALRPGQCLVSPQGDLWRWDGYVVPAGAVANQAAASLKRKNRLAEISASAEEAEEQVAILEEQAKLSFAAFEHAKADAARMREKFRSAEDARAAHERNAAQLESSLLALQAKRTSQDAIAAGRYDEREAAFQDVEDARLALRAFQATIDPPEDEGALRAAVEAARSNWADARAATRNIEQDAARQRDRRVQLERDIDQWSRRLGAAASQYEAMQERIAETALELEEAKATPRDIDLRREKMETELQTATERLTAATDALAARDAAIKEAAQIERTAERELASAREDRARHEARIEAAAERAVEFAATLEEAAGCAPDQFLENQELDPDSLPTVKDLERDLGDLKRRREKLGAVNLRADQELEEVSTERAHLAREQADLEAAVNKLRQGVSAINKEGRDRLVAAFDEVNKNFSALFTHLFDGGDAKLVLVESDDPLEAGLEIMCQPPDKRLTSLSLLSGGEQTLTAISLIFAVFLVNPAPICVLDEVDAPLDDANVGRFCDLLDEMKRRTNTRFLIITHHAISMSRMDRLFGVTMIEKGVSQLVSVDLEAAQLMVDSLPAT